MSKHQLTDQTRLRYIGRYFEGFCAERPFMTFLGYDCGGWSTIWVKYLGEIRMIALGDVELAPSL